MLIKTRNFISAMAELSRVWGVEKQEETELPAELVRVVMLHFESIPEEEQAKVLLMAGGAMSAEEQEIKQLLAEEKRHALKFKFWFYRMFTIGFFAFVGFLLWQLIVNGQLSDSVLNALIEVFLTIFNKV